jgi:hypothetical protein
MYIDPFSTCDNQVPEQSTTISSMSRSVYGQHQLQQRENPHQQSRPRSQLTNSSGNQSEPQSSTMQANHQLQSFESQSQRQDTNNAKSPAQCRCTRSLSSLLHDLKHPGRDSTPPTAFDNVLSRVADAIALWDNLVTCMCWWNTNDNAETLLLATLSIRRVVALVRGVGQALDSTGSCDLGTDDPAPKLSLGMYEVTGPERTIVLEILRKVTVRKLGAAITTMQSLLQTKQAQPETTDTATLSYIKSILDDSAGLNK